MDSKQAWYGIRWLDAVRAHSGRTRYAWAAAAALMPYTDNATGEAQVSLARMADDTRQPLKALRRGFEDLERLGLLERHKRRKAGSQEWDTTLYRPRLPGAIGQKPPTAFVPVTTKSSVPKTGSKRPTGSDVATIKHVDDDPLCACDDCIA